MCNCVMIPRSFLEKQRELDKRDIPRILIYPNIPDIKPSLAIGKSTVSKSTFEALVDKDSQCGVLIAINATARKLTTTSTVQMNRQSTNDDVRSALQCINRKINIGIDIT